MPVEEVESNVKTTKKKTAKKKVTPISGSVEELEAQSKQGEEIRKSIGDELSWEGEPVNKFSVTLQNTWRDLREISQPMEANYKMDAAIIAFLVSKNRKLIRRLVRQTVRQRAIYDPETYEEVIPASVIKCPLLDAIEDWMDETFEDPKKEQAACELSNEILRRLNASEFETEDKEEGEDDSGND